MAGWARFRRWPGWVQGLAWVFLWPVPLALLAASKPRGHRRRWVVLAIVGVLAWVAFGAAERARSTTSTGTAAPPTTAARRSTTTERQVPSTTTSTSTSTTVAAAGALRTTAGQPDPYHPDPALTPGATFPGVTSAQVCVSGYSASVRDVPEAEKDAVYARYGITSRAPGEYEVDHLISLELGGSNDITNLWPEPTDGPDGSFGKDAVEDRLHRWVCDGSMSLADAQGAILHWEQVPGSPPAASPPAGSAGLQQQDCTPGYDPCIPPGPDVDCAGGSGDGPRYVQGPVRVTGDDPYGLDGNHDGVACG